MRKHIYRILGLLGIAAASLGANAQELNESLYVEGEYIPDIIRMEKLHLLPTKVSFDLTATPPPYTLTGVSTNYTPDILALPTQGWRSSRAGLTRRGYLDLGAGSNLNIVGSAGYRFLNTDKAKAGFMLQHNSTSLFKPHISAYSADFRRHRYDEVAGLYGSFLTDHGTIDASLYYHLGYFNYYGMYPLEYKHPTEFPTQTLNDFTATVGWKGIGAPLDYSVSAGVRYYGYRRYEEYYKGSRETDIMLNANVTKTLSDVSKIGILADADLLLYNNVDPDNVPLDGNGGSYDADDENFGDKGASGAKYYSWPQSAINVDNYAKVTLTPFYRFTNGSLAAQLGANVDFTFNAGVKGHRYSAVHISPATSVEWATKGFGAYLRLNGGSRLQTLAERGKWDYYQDPTIGNTMPAYTPIDATLGLNFGPWSGFSAGIAAEYAFNKNVLLGGWYMADPSAYPENDYFMTIKGVRLAANAKYEYGDFFSLSGSIAYHNQNKEHGFFNGYDRPRWIIDLAATVNPLDNVAVSLNYQYRGVRNIYSDGAEYIGGQFPEYIATRLPDITLLGVGARWQPLSNLSIWGEVNNLLGCKAVLLPNQYQEGVNFAVGFGVTF